MKSISLLLLACVSAAPAFSQDLPDEINAAPYEARYRNIEQLVSEASVVAQRSEEALKASRKQIADLELQRQRLIAKIRNAEAQIIAGRNEIPQLQAKIRQLRNEQFQLDASIPQTQNLVAQTKASYDAELLKLKPLQEKLELNKKILSNHLEELAVLKRSEAQSQELLTKAQAQFLEIEKKITVERGTQAKLESDSQNFSLRLASLNSALQSNERRLVTTSASLEAEQKKLKDLQSRVVILEGTLAELELSGAPADQIAAAKKNLESALITRDVSARRVASLEEQLKGIQSEIATAKVKIEELKTDYAKIPTLIAESKVREEKLIVDRNTKAGELAKLQSEALAAKKVVDEKEKVVAEVRTELDKQQVLVNTQAQVVAVKAAQLDKVTKDLEAQRSRYTAISGEITATNRRLREIETEIPRLSTIVRASQTELATVEQTLVVKRAQEVTLAEIAAADKDKLTKLTAAMNVVRGQMEERQSLYLAYQREAALIGSTQGAAAAPVVGTQEGEKLSRFSASQNALAVGKDLGTAEAKYWALIRGEITGFDKGYAEGMASVEDRARGESEGTARGTADAAKFADVNLKPSFFEEFFVQELRKPITARPRATMPLVAKSFLENRIEFSFAQNSVTPVSPNEIARSAEIVTMLDPSITQMAKDVRSLEGKASTLRDPKVSYQEATEIPFGKIDCSAVYKNVKVLAEACVASYKVAFTDNFKMTMRAAFFEQYPKTYDSILVTTLDDNREAVYPVELPKYFKVAQGEGLTAGKKDIYQASFAKTYRTAYDTELPKSRERVKTLAASEVVTFVSTNPALTLAQSQLEGADFRGGFEVKLTGQVKNVSKVSFQGPVLVKITDVVNGEAVNQEVVLNGAAGSSLSQIPAMAVKISPTARGGEKIVLKGQITLPGTPYKSQRIETFEVSQVLLKNISSDVTYVHDRTPAIRGFFGNRSTHDFTAKIVPTVENISEGYKLELKATGPHAGLITIKTATIASGALVANRMKQVRFQYSFLDAAKGKTIPLEFQVYYAGKMIKIGKTDVTPR